MKESNTMGTKDRGQNRKWQNESEKQLQSARLHAEKAGPRSGCRRGWAPCLWGCCSSCWRSWRGDSVWKSAHQILFGLFGCGSFVLGAAVCYLAILYTRGQDLLMQVFKLLLGLIFASGTVIVFSDIPADLTAAQMIAACYQNGANAWLGGGVLGTLLGGNLLLLCGRPAANLVMAVLALCASLYIFDITPAECWQWLCNVGGGVHEKGVAVYEQNAARRAERLAARQAEEEYCAEEPAGDYDDNFDEEDVPGGIPVPGWLSGVFSWGHKVTKEMEGEAEPAPVDDSLGYEPPAPVEPEPVPAQPAPAFEPVKVTSNHPRAAFDIDLGPDTSVSEGGSEPIEPIIIGPGGTFGQDPLQKAPPRAIVKPVVPDAVETAAEDFFAPAGSPAPAPVVNPTVPPAAPEAPAAAPAEPVQPEMPVFQTPTLPTTDEPVVPVRVSAENAVAMRSEPDEDGWISITSEPVEEKRPEHAGGGCHGKTRRRRAGCRHRPGRGAGGGGDLPVSVPQHRAV